MAEPTAEELAAKEKRDALKAVIKESLQELADDRIKAKKEKKKDMDWIDELFS